MGKNHAVPIASKQTSKILGLIPNTRTRQKRSSRIAKWRWMKWQGMQIYFCLVWLTQHESKPRRGTEERKN
jgi:hypothetical protein